MIACKKIAADARHQCAYNAPVPKSRRAGVRLLALVFPLGFPNRPAVTFGQAAAKLDFAKVSTPTRNFAKEYNSSETLPAHNFHDPSHEVDHI